MTVSYLNLARKWRSKNFDEIVGQEISVRILKNSLYLDQLFPVYLFSGQRGCGKTSTARIFAAAINCFRFTDFQKDPKNITIPCLSCESCLAMAAGAHPDFIEMDAASHTGVENVRTIIDAASLLPVMGRKKIYLIDEAHMLSKAAFNAFLKILEEPPASVLFILATTDIQKIIDTVRSRCFQLFFTAIESNALVKHLEVVCAAEGIEYEVPALQLIVHETEGSARDALTLVEQIKFSHKKVSLDAVYALLGHVSQEVMITLFGLLVKQDVQNLLMYSEQINIAQYDPVRMWQALQELVRAAMFVQYGVKNRVSYADSQQFLTIAKLSSQEQLYSFMKILHGYEVSLQKSTAQTALIEMMLLQMASLVVYKQAEQVIKQPSRIVENVQVKTVMKESAEPAKIASEQVTHELMSNAPVLDVIIKNNVEQDQDNRWAKFIEQINLLSDPLLISIFKQALFVNYDADIDEVQVSFTQSAPFFTEWLVESKDVWTPYLTKEFGQKTTLKCSAQAGAVKASGLLNTVSGAGTVSNKVVSEVKREAIKNNTTQTTTVDVSDKEQWAMANTLLETFGGTLTEVKDE
ncbi:DNA polymerase III subunit gamma/tau [bacterium]|nr:DNA polymerase III subunit gamma/tau [bacterium]